MIQFQKMIETVRTNRTIRYLDGQVLPPPATDIDEFFDLAARAEVFVFTSKYDTPETIKLHDENGRTIRKEFDAPFPIFTIEVLDGQIMVPTLGTSPDEHLTVHSLLVWEVSPKKFSTYVYATLEDREFVFLSRSFDVLVSSFVDRLNSERMGLEKIRQRINLGVGSAKRKVTFRQITYVRPKSVSSTPGLSTRSIDWSHRWFVRGHWRKSNQLLGKDRAGIYWVEGYTWVVEHLKGPETAPVMRKTRLVEL